MPVHRLEVLGHIIGELEDAYAKHGHEQWRRHEFYGILLEEVEELWDCIKRNEPEARLLEELYQVAAVCIRYAETSPGELCAA